MKHKRLIFFIFFMIGFIAMLYLCDQREYHRYDAGNQINFAMLFIYQGILAVSARNTFFVNMANRSKALFINSAIVFACCIFIFQLELLRAIPVDTPVDFVLRTIFDPNIFLLHFIYATALFMALKIYEKIRIKRSINV